MIQLVHLYTSPGHNFFGHHGKPPSDLQMVENDAINCLAGRGIEGDRFCDYKENYIGQITFFEHEVFLRLCQQLQVFDKPPSVFRRNVITRGVELSTLHGCEFLIQGVQFKGVEECKPCHWMNTAFGPGAEKALEGIGGLRAKIVSNGILKRDR